MVAKFFLSLFSFLVFQSLVFAQLKLEIRLSPKETIVQCEPNRLYIAIENMSKDNLKVEGVRNLIGSSLLTLYVNGAASIYFPLQEAILGFGSDPRLGPGERVDTSMGLSYPVFNTPGKYQIQLIADFSRSPGGFFSGRIESNIVLLTVQTPTGEDFLAWQDAYLQIIHAEGLAGSHDERSLCSRLFDSMVLKEHPKSIYMAYALWRQGLSGSGSWKEIGPEREFGYNQSQQEFLISDPGALESWQKSIRDVIEPWEELNQNFTDFVYRDQLLFELSRAYIRIGQSQKAIALLKELLQRHPRSEHAGKAEEYKQFLHAKNVWKE